MIIRDSPGILACAAALATRVFDRPLNDCHLVHIGRLSKLRGNEGGIDDGQGGAALTGYPTPPRELGEVYVPWHFSLEVLTMSDLTWRQFEILCESLIRESLDPQKWRIASQRRRQYADGETKIMDFHIAERRQGGRGIVIDCKHFPKAPLNENEIRTTVDYKRRSRASKAIILISSESNYDERFLQAARMNDVDVQVVSTQNAGRLKLLLDGLFGRKPLFRVPGGFDH